MKLAEALILRKDMESKIDNLYQQIVKNLYGQEGDTAIFDPNELIAELVKLNDELIRLVSRINHTNHVTKIDDTMTLAQAMIRRENLKKLVLVLNKVEERTGERHDRYSASEIRYISFIDERKLREKINELSKEIRILDGIIQEQNWLTILM